MEFRKLRQHGAARVAAWTMTVALAGWVPGTGIALAASPEMAGMSPALTVASNPIGAAVYVDGKAVGETPVQLKVAAGDHRVKVVKDGYLDNSRVVSVVAGRPSRLSVNLTPDAGQARVRVEPRRGSSGEGAGGSGKKIALIAVGVAAVSAGAYLATRSTNHPPTAGGVTANPSTGLAGATNIVFSVSASDPDSDSLSYGWDFGDGATGTGQAPSHIYDSAGSYAVRVTVSDGDKSATGTGAVNITTLSGRWTGLWLVSMPSDSMTPISISLDQRGTNLSGSFAISWAGTDRSFPGRCHGTLSGMRVSLTFELSGNFDPFTFSGQLNSTYDTIQGTTNRSGLAGTMQVRR
jgi:PKD repeat protein